MAAYAALVSLLNTITLKTMPRPFHPPISIDGELLKALQERLNFLVEFLEEGWRVTTDLEGQIVDAANAAEDIIANIVVDQTLHESTVDNQKLVVLLSQDLRKIIEDIDSIMIEVMQNKERSGDKNRRPWSTISTGTSNAPNHENKMVGFDDKKCLLMEKLVGQQSRQRVISIVGMGGIGKTTLARNIYDDAYMMQYFDIRAWVTMSKEYNVRENLIELLRCIRPERTSDKEFMDKCEDTLGGQVYKSLCGMRYLIVVDDIWSMDALNEIRRFLPDNNLKSRILITTRESNVANDCSTSVITMRLLDEDSSWNLLCQKVFQQGSCPINLQQIGRKIAKNCGGLPLALVTMGGLLAKSDFTIECWNHIVEDVRGTMNLDSDEHCLKILYSSYDHLPVHLKPCLLYMGVFPEDREIRASQVCRLWVAEGILKSIEGKCLEEIAEEFLKDLTERNLIFVRRWGYCGKIKVCYVHDLVRDLCLREAQRKKFLNIHDRQAMHGVRRFVFHPGKTTDNQIHEFLVSKSIVFSLTCDPNKLVWPFYGSKFLKVLNASEKVLRESNKKGDYPLRFISNFLNLRYMAFSIPQINPEVTYSISLPRNLQTLEVRGRHVLAPFNIWKMQQLRYVKSRTIHLPKVSLDRDDNEGFIVLENLHTLMYVNNFQFSEEVVKRIPNIKKLKLYYDTKSFSRVCEGFHYGLHNLVHLEKLESLSCHFIQYEWNWKLQIQNFILPHSVKKLTLFGCQLDWDDMTVIGSLPNLEMLRLLGYSFEGREWNPIEGQFQNLKYLYLAGLVFLETWNADLTHFPRLEQLVLATLPMFEEIPLEIGEIPTLRLIDLICCQNSAIMSAKNIVDEQESLGNVGLHVKVFLTSNQSELLSLATNNFHIKIETGKSDFTKYMNQRKG